MFKWQLEKKLNFNLKEIYSNRYPIIQGGMGIGVSLFPLASAVGKEGCIGTISSVSLDRLVAKRIKVDKLDYIEATAREVTDTKQNGGVAAINIMVALPLFYEKAVQGAVEGGIDMIISGAGLPTTLPSSVKSYAGKNHDINLVPIISSARAFKILCKQWGKRNYRPDAVILEGPKAGGHLGWNYNQMNEYKNEKEFLEDNELYKLLKHTEWSDQLNNIN